MDSTTSRTDALVCDYLRDMMNEYGLTQADLQKVLNGRSKGYVNDRVLGKRSWAISELDRIAPLLRLPDALALIAAASGHFRTQAEPADKASEETGTTAGSPADSPAVDATERDSADAADIDLANLDPSNRDDLQFIAAHPELFGAVAKDGDILAEQEGMEELP